MAERVVIIGAGIAGLSAALALSATGREIVVLERDGPPPDGGAEAAFDHWARRGVGHLRQSHAFLARLRSLIKDEHPALYDALRDAGAREIGFVDGLPEGMKKTYRPQPKDAELSVLVSRRTTIELVMRRHVESLPGVTLKTEVFVTGLITDHDASGALTVRGVTTDKGEERGDLIVDAGGRSSPVNEWLVEAGATIPEEVEDCSILYFSRFYRFREGQGEPPRGRHGGTGDLGFIKFGLFPADNGTFSMTLAVPEVEMELRAAVVRPEVFDAICASFPGIAPWTDPARSEGVSKVCGMGDLKSRWREMAPGGAPVALNLFCVGDSVVRTNPLFGRGCSFAAVAAHRLRDVLAETADPAERARRYSAALREALRPYYDDMVTQDLAAARRARNGLDPDYRPTFRGNLMRSFVEDGVAIAIRRDVGLLRAAMRGFHMLEDPRAWLRKPSAMAKVLAAWARGKRANAAYYTPKPGPDRATMFDALGLPQHTDWERLKAA